MAARAKNLKHFSSSSLNQRFVCKLVYILCLYVCYYRRHKVWDDNGLFHLISIHPLWMTFNKCPGGIFEACPGGSKTNFNEGN